LENDVLASRLNITGTPDGILSFATSISPQHGTVEYDALGNFYYRPAQGYIGSDIFTYDVSDSGVYLGSATVTVSVVRRPPNWSWEAGSTLPKQKGTFPGSALQHRHTGRTRQHGLLVRWRRPPLHLRRHRLTVPPPGLAP